MILAAYALSLPHMRKLPEYVSVAPMVASVVSLAIIGFFVIGILFTARGYWISVDRLLKLRRQTIRDSLAKERVRAQRILQWLWIVADTINVIVLSTMLGAGRYAASGGHPHDLHHLATANLIWTLTLGVDAVLIAAQSGVRQLIMRLIFLAPRE